MAIEYSGHWAYLCISLQAYFPPIHVLTQNSSLYIRIRKIKIFVHFNFVNKGSYVSIFSSYCILLEIMHVRIYVPYYYT